MTTDSRDSDCCAVDPRIASHFDHRLEELTVDGELPEMVDVSLMLLGLLDDVGDRAPSVLELGCGSGALSVELLLRGAQRVDGIDMSAANVAAATERAQSAAVADRAAFAVGDGATAAAEAHDWVLLDRVICCYPDVDKLVSRAVALGRERVCFSVPTSRGWRGLVNRVAWTVENVPTWLLRNGCPTFVHDVGRVERILATAGFTRRADDRLGLWYAAVWQR